MFIKYKNLPSNSRVWIYQSAREFSNKEVDFIALKSEDFINQWTRHGDDLKGSFTIKYRQFLILAVDESFNNISGCSIDSSVRFIQELEEKFEIVLLDKMNVTFKQGDYFVHKQLSDFRKMAKSKSVTKETIVFNNLVDTKSDFKNNWEIPAEQSWHGRFMS